MKQTTELFECFVLCLLCIRFTHLYMQTHDIFMNICLCVCEHSVYLMHPHVVMQLCDVMFTIYVSCEFIVSRCRVGSGGPSTNSWWKFHPAQSTSYPPFMGGVITNETWTCSPTMLLIYATVSQMPRNQMNNGNANHMPTWIHPCPPDEQKEKAPVLMFL